MAARTRQYLKERFTQGQKPQQDDFWDLLESYALLTETSSMLRLATGSEVTQKVTDKAISPYWVNEYVKGEVTEDGNTLYKLRELIRDLQNWRSQMTQADTDDIVNTITEIVAKFNGFPKGGQTLLQMLGAKADVGHTHDDRYYTETEMDTKLNEKENAIPIKNDAFNKNFGSLEAYTSRANKDLVARNIDTLRYRGATYDYHNGSKLDLNTLQNTEHMGIYIIPQGISVDNAPFGINTFDVLVVVPYNDVDADGFGCYQEYISNGRVARRFKLRNDVGSTSSWRAWQIYNASQYQLLGMGQVNAGGSEIKMTSGWVPSKTATGQYLITHNIGHTNYNVSANVMHLSTGTTSTEYCTIVDVTPNSFKIWTRNGYDGITYDADFNFQVFGY